MPDTAPIDLPFAYRATYRPKRARNEKEGWLTERVPVSLRVLEPGSAPVVLTLSDPEDGTTLDGPWRHDGERFLKPLRVGLFLGDDQRLLNVAELRQLVAGVPPDKWKDTLWLEDPPKERIRPWDTNYPLPTVPAPSPVRRLDDRWDGEDVFGPKMEETTGNVAAISRSDRDERLREAVAAAAAMAVIDGEVWVECREPVLYNHYGTMAVDTEAYALLDEYAAYMPSPFLPATAADDPRLVVEQGRARQALAKVHDPSVFTDRFLDVALPVIRETVIHHADEFAKKDLLTDPASARRARNSIAVLVACDEAMAGRASHEDVYAAIADLLSEESWPLGHLKGFLDAARRYGGIQQAPSRRPTAEDEAALEALDFPAP